VYQYLEEIEMTDVRTIIDLLNREEIDKQEIIDMVKHNFKEELK